MFCNECGKEIDENAKFCSICGARQPEKIITELVAVDNQSEKNKNTDNDVNLQFKIEKSYECAETILSIAISPNGKYIAIGERKKIDGLCIRDIITLKEVNRYLPNRVVSISYGPDFNNLVISNILGEKDMWPCYVFVYSFQGDGITSKDIVQLKKGSDMDLCESLSFSPDGKRIIGTVGGSPRLWDAIDGEQLMKYPKDAEKIIYHPNESKLISFNKEGIFIWDEDSAEEVAQISVESNISDTIRLKTLLCSVDGNNVIAGTYCGKILIWNLKTLECIKRLQIADNDEIINSISYHQGYNNIFSISTCKGIIIWDIKNEKEIKKLNLENAFWSSFTPDGQSLLAASDKKIIKWSVTREK